MHNDLIDAVSASHLYNKGVTPMKNFKTQLMTIFTFIIGAVIAGLLIMGFATIGLFVLGVFFSLIICSAIYHYWQQRKLHSTF